MPAKYSLKRFVNVGVNPPPSAVPSADGTRTETLGMEAPGEAGAGTAAPATGGPAMPTWITPQSLGFTTCWGVAVGIASAVDANTKVSDWHISLIVGIIVGGLLVFAAFFTSEGLIKLNRGIVVLTVLAGLANIALMVMGIQGVLSASTG